MRVSYMKTRFSICTLSSRSTNLSFLIRCAKSALVFCLTSGRGLHDATGRSFYCCTHVPSLPIIFTSRTYLRSSIRTTISHFSEYIPLYRPRGLHISHAALQWTARSFPVARHRQDTLIQLSPTAARQASSLKMPPRPRLRNSTAQAITRSRYTMQT